MNLLFTNREPENQEFIKEICNDILSKKIEEKPYNEGYCGIFIDGRARSIDTLEDLTCLTSFKLYSKFNYPILMFINGNIGFENKEKIIKDYRIEVIKIPELNSHSLYSEFCIKQLPFLISSEYEQLLFISPDGMLISYGWENFLENTHTNYLGSKWSHSPNIQIKYNNIWMEFTDPVFVGNGGFSYRTLSTMKFISQTYRDKELREMGTKDKVPPEDLFYSVFTNMYGRLATIEQCDNFCIDPMTPEIWKEHKEGKRQLYGFHYFKT